MDRITKETYEALSRYFTALSQSGYMPYGEVDKLLVFLYIQELIEGKYNVTITEQDYKILQESLYCLYGSTCLIPYTEYVTLPTTPLNTTSSLSSTEDDNIVYNESYT